MKIYNTNYDDYGEPIDGLITVFLQADSDGNIINKSYSDVLTVNKTGYTFVMAAEDVQKLRNYKIVNGKLTQI